MEIELIREKEKLISWSWRRSGRDLLMPAVCFACEKPISPESEVLLCQSCYRTFHPEDLQKLCTGCGARFPGEASMLSDCFFCRSWNAPFNSVTSVANYLGPLREFVIRMKRRGGQIMALQLGTLLALHLRNRLSHEVHTDIDWVTPMPCYWQRRLRRGFNVPDLLAESIVGYQQFRGKFKKTLRVRHKTQKQGTLTQSQRFKNVKNCFRIYGNSSLKGATIRLVDDVMTSGATAIQAASTLRNAGAAEIHLAIVARGIGQR